MSLPFYIVNAFTPKAYDGNPAVIVLVEDFLDPAVMQKLATNFNQPMTMFLRLTSPNDPAATSLTYDVRWFTVSSPIPICGHATLAAAGLLFSEPSLIPNTVASISFHANSGVTLAARKAGDWVEISLASSLVRPLPPADAERVSGILRKALGETVDITFVGVGTKQGMEHYLLAEVDEKCDLGSLKVNVEPLVELAPEITVNLVTSSHSGPDASFDSRMFAPASGVPEDHVCGSAHCLLVPYWDAKLGNGGKEMMAKQVSARGGDLKVRWKEPEGLVELGGKTKMIVKGEVYL